MFKILEKYGSIILLALIILLIYCYIRKEAFTEVQLCNKIEIDGIVVGEECKTVQSNDNNVSTSQILDLGQLLASNPNGVINIGMSSISNTTI